MKKLQLRGEVVGKSTASKIIKLKTRITNEQGKILVDGEARIIIRND